MKSRIPQFNKAVTKTKNGQLYNGEHLFNYYDKTSNDYEQYVITFEKGYIHNNSGPAVRFTDGWEEYWEEGVFKSALSSFGVNT